MKLNFFIACSLALISPLGFSDSYQKGYYYCDSFKEAEEEYKTSPNFFSGMGYAKCLILKGRVNEGLSILYNIVNQLMETLLGVGVVLILVKTYNQNQKKSVRDPQKEVKYEHRRKTKGSY